MRRISLLGRTFPAIYLVPVGFAVVAETATWAAWLWAPKRAEGIARLDEEGKKN
jgi:hypothetical protein